MKNFKVFLTSQKGLWILFTTWALFITQLWLPRVWSFFGSNDWDLTYSMFEVARKSLVDYMQWPQHNPWMAFGSDLNANPQAGHISIFFIPILLFGTFYGYKLSILMAVIIGAVGSEKFFSSLNKNKATSICGAMLFCAATYFSSHIFIAGHSNTLYIYLLPWLAFAFIKLRVKYSLKYFLWGVALLAQMIAGGAPVVFIISSAFLFFWALGEWWIYKNHSLSFYFIALIISSVLLTLWKIIPAMDLWAQTPRLVTDDSGINILQWLQSLAGYHFRTGTWHGTFEYSLGFSLVFLGVILTYRNTIKGFWQWCLLGLFLVWFCMGNSPYYANPWYWINHYIPPFTSIRAPSRFGIVIVFTLVTALVFVLNQISDKKLLYGIIIAGVFSQSLAFLADASHIKDSRLFLPDISGVQNRKIPESVITKNGHSFEAILQNKSVMNAYEPLELQPVKDTIFNFIKGGNIVHFSPNKYTIKATESMVLLNLRHSPFWKISDNTPVFSHRGLLAFQGKTNRTYILEYNNRKVYIGCIAALLFIPFVLLSHIIFKRNIA